MKPIDPDKITDDAYQRLQKLLDSRVGQRPKVVKPELSKEERIVLRRRVAEKLVDFGKVEEYHADLLSDRVVEMVEQELDNATKKAAEKVENGTDGMEKFKGSFRRSED